MSANYKIISILVCLMSSLNVQAQESSTFTDERDGETYNIITYKELGKTWFVENLRYKVKGSKCANGEEQNCSTYGRLYSGKMLKKACPDGWHVATKKEWIDLLTHFGGYLDHSARLASDIAEIKNKRQREKAMKSLYAFYSDDKEIGVNPGNTLSNLETNGFNIQYAGAKTEEDYFDLDTGFYYYGTIKGDDNLVTISYSKLSKEPNYVKYNERPFGIYYDSLEEKLIALQYEEMYSCRCVED